MKFISKVIIIAVVLILTAQFAQAEDWPMRGHSFIIIIKGAYPINFLNAIKNVVSVCNIYCATANDVEVIVAETEQGSGILGVIDGLKSRGIESETDIEKRRKFLRNVGYKF